MHVFDEITKWSFAGLICGVFILGCIGLIWEQVIHFKARRRGPYDWMLDGECDNHSHVRFVDVPSEDLMAELLGYGDGS